MSSMKFVYQAQLLSIFFVSSLACGQEPTKPTSQSGPAPLELKLTKGKPASKSPYFVPILDSQIMGRFLLGTLCFFLSCTIPCFACEFGRGRPWVLRTKIQLKENDPSRVQLLGVRFRILAGKNRLTRT